MDEKNRKVYEVLDSLSNEKDGSESDNKTRAVRRVHATSASNSASNKIDGENNPQSNRQPQSHQSQRPSQHHQQSKRIVEDIPDERKKSKKRKKKKRKSHNGLKLCILLVVIFGVSIFLSAIIISLGKDMLGVNDNSETVVVTIPEGSTVSDIAYMLKDEGIIENPRFFILFSKISKSDSLFIAGEHEVRGNMAYETIINSLTSDAISDENAITVTFVEGITIPEAAEMLEIEGVCDSDEFIEEFNNDHDYGYTYEDYLPTFISNYRFYKYEGYLFPDTYTFYADMSPELVCQKILQNFDDKITDEMYKQMDEMDFTIDDVLVLASIVQKEAGTVEDMSLVASVFLNRLDHPETYPKLQSDTTSTYIEETIKPHIEEIDQDLFDAYDTYTCTGLPAGAVCNPGLDAIEAVLDPASSDYYYFYSDIYTGETYFAETYEEHLENIEMVNEKYGITSETETEESTDEETEE